MQNQISLPQDCATNLPQANRGGTSECQSFHRFFERWLLGQNQHLQELITASGQYHKSTGTASTAESAQAAPESVLLPLINRVIKHYEQYYRAKSRWAHQHVLGVLSPSWISPLEEAFLWVGGWRPSMAFHLLYTKAGLQLEEGLADLIRGLSTGDLGDLSPSQLSQVDALQRRTIIEEREITEEMAKHQETVADSSMVELTHAVTELLRERRGGESGLGGPEEDRVKATLAPKVGGLEHILQMADDLRLRTLRAILDVLNPIQAVHFLIAAAELHLRLHDWGKKMEEGTQHH